LAETRELGYTGSANLLVRYLNQGRVDAERTPPSPRRLVSWLMTKPENSALTTTATFETYSRPARTGPCWPIGSVRSPVY
jgi:hypothetical protein